MTLTAPLKRMVITQGFGEDRLGKGGPGGQSYADIGLKKGHNGWDLSCVSGTPAIACMDGYIEYTDGGSGYGRDISLFSRERGLEAKYGHLQGLVGQDGRKVRAGEVIALTDNTGFSTADHLHWAVRRREWYGNSDASRVLDSDNGYFGYIDPTEFFPDEVWYRKGREFKLPVDYDYGLRKPGMSYLDYQKANAYFYRVTGRLMNTRERSALRYGYWDLRTVLDPAMYTVWTEKHKPQYLKESGQLKP